MVKNKARLKHVVPNYAVYMGLFIGTGFLSGAIVHFPLDPVRFSIIGLIGAAIFVASSTINEITMQQEKVSVARVMKLITFSIVLALGVGMISGGVQHFDEVPEYASILIPLGVVLSLIGYILKHGIDLHKVESVRLGLATVVFVAVLGTGLNTYAKTLDSAGHGEEASETQDSQEATETTIPSGTTTPTFIEESSDGHAH